MNLTPPVDASSGPSRRKRTVRILTPSSQVRIARLSLMLAGAAALGVILVYRTWEAEEPRPVIQRTIRDMELDWRCEGGHVFRMHGQQDPTPCPICNRPSYPVAAFWCPEHGNILIAYKFRTLADGGTEIAAIQFPGRPWELHPDVMTCPRCNREMRMRSEDPLSSYDRSRK